MTDREALLQAILESEPPAAFDAMYVYADWLDERGIGEAVGWRAMAAREIWPTASAKHHSLLIAYVVANDGLGTIAFMNSEGRMDVLLIEVAKYLSGQNWVIASPAANIGSSQGSYTG